ASRMAPRVHDPGHCGGRNADALCGALETAAGGRDARRASTVRPVRPRPNFIVLYVSSALAIVATAIPFVFLPVYAREHGVSEVAAASLISCIGLTSMLGRVGLGTLADSVGLIRLYQLAVLALGLSYFLWLGAHGYAMLVL